MNFILFDFILFQAKVEAADGDASGSGEVKEKKKSRGKKNKLAKEGLNGVGFQPPPEAELDFSGLQILSKAEWKKLRNTYLNLQRKNMGQVGSFISVLQM